MAKKQRNGEGTLCRRKSGKYEYRITYVDEMGGKKRKSFSGITPDDCYEQADAFLYVQNLKNQGVNCDITIPDILKEKYADDFELNYVSESAYARNLGSLKRIEKSPIGSVPIMMVTEIQLEAFMKSMTHYSNSEIGKSHQQLKLAYEIAIEDGLVGRNLMKTRKLARRPKSSRPDKVVKGLTEEEQLMLIRALELDKVPGFRNNYKNQLKIELYTGMRMGEINALKHEDIDFSRGIIHVRRTVSRGLNARNYLKDSPKTDAGNRDVPINEMAKPVLEDAIMKAPKNRYGLLFYDAKKKDFIDTQQVNSYFRRLCKKAEIEVRGQHCLRHSFATRCIEAGVPAIVLKTWLGHTDIHITLDTYADVFNRMNNDAMKKFEDYTSVLNADVNGTI